MKISIITAVFNNVSFIENTIQSIANQSYNNIEHIVVDGGSTDGTVDIIKKYSDTISCWISEPDKGIYDAMNKGIKLATGDYVGILNSDDVYFDQFAIESVVQTLSKNHSESCYADLIYVDRKNTDIVVRYWKSGAFSKKRFERGWMPPHPTFFAKKSMFEKYGYLNTDFPLAADYELMLRLLYKHNVSTAYIPKVLVKMRIGGTSKPGLYTLKAIIENYRAWKINNLKINILTFLIKPISKILQYLRK